MAKLTMKSALRRIEITTKLATLERLANEIELSADLTNDEKDQLSINMDAARDRFALDLNAPVESAETLKKTKAEAPSAEQQSELAEILQKGFEAHPKATIRQLALQLGVPYYTLRAAAITPIEGREYNANEVNWARVAFKLGAAKVEQIEWALFDEARSRKSNEGNEGKSSTKTKDISAYAVGTWFTFRRDRKSVFAVVYVNDQYIVAVDINSGKPSTFKHSTFWFQGPQIEASATYASTVEVETEDIEPSAEPEAEIAIEVEEEEDEDEDRAEALRHAIEMKKMFGRFPE